MARLVRGLRGAEEILSVIWGDFELNRNTPDKGYAEVNGANAKDPYLFYLRTVTNTPRQTDALRPATRVYHRSNNRISWTTLGSTTRAKQGVQVVARPNRTVPTKKEPICPSA